MSKSDERPPTPPDDEERRQRAAELHEQIERLKSGSPPDERDRPRRPSPREFTEQSVREEIEHEQPSDEDSQSL